MRLYWYICILVILRQFGAKRALSARFDRKGIGWPTGEGGHNYVRVSRNTLELCPGLPQARVEESTARVGCVSNCRRAMGEGGHNYR